MTVKQLRSLTALCIHIRRYLLGHGLLCAMHMYNIHLKGGAILLLHHGCVCWVSQERRGYSMSAVTGNCAIQERINASVVPTAPWVSFQTSGSCIAYPRFNEQYTQWDTARQLASRIGWSAIQFPSMEWSSREESGQGRRREKARTRGLGAEVQTMWCPRELVLHWPHSLRLLCWLLLISKHQTFHWAPQLNSQTSFLFSAFIHILSQGFQNVSCHPLVDGEVDGGPLPVIFNEIKEISLKMSEYNICGKDQFCFIHFESACVCLCTTL